MLALAGSAIDFVLNAFSVAVFLLCFGTFIETEIAAVAINALFVARQRFRRNRHIVFVRRRDLRRMNEAAFLVHADMCFVTEVPRAALLGGMRFGITLLFLVFRGRWQFNKR